MGSLFWIIIAGIFLLLELIIPGLVTIWFGLAGIIMVFLSPFVNDPSTEFYIFAVLSLILLIITRPLVKKYFYKNDKDDISFGNRTIGRETKITGIIDESIYEVKLDDKMWRGISEVKLEVGEHVIIEGITGNKLILKNKYK